MSEQLRAQLLEIPGIRLRVDEPLSRHTPLRVGGPAELWAVAEDEAALSAALSAARREKVPWRVHWPLADWLVRDGGVRGLILRPGRAFEVLAVEGDQVRIGAAALWGSLAALKLPEALRPLARWPGSVGALLESPEAGRLTGLAAEISWLRGRRVERVEIGPAEAPPEIPKTAIPLALALRTAPEVVRGRRRPWLERPVVPGALFVSPKGEDLGVLLSDSNLAGTRLRSWRLSPHAPGAVVQLGGGSCKDVLLLAQGLQERVERSLGVTLKPRLPILGTDRGLPV